MALPRKGFKGLTLRATLRLLGVGALLYVAVIAVVIGVRITPTARALHLHSERVLREYEAITDRSAALHGTIDELEMWLFTVARPTAMGAALATLRRRIDSLAALATEAPDLSAIPAAMRAHFVHANAEQLRAATALGAALTSIERGRPGDAERQLSLADSIARLIDRYHAAAQRGGLVDLIAREHELADAASASIRAVGWWLAFGILLAPAVIVFVRRRFYDPLEDLAEGIAQVADGDLGWTIPVRRADELGLLSEHFNAAAAILCQRAEETRERAQTALRESEEKYEAMVEAAPIGIAVVNSDGRYVHTNPALQRFLGYSEAQLRGKSYREVTLPDDLAESDRRFAELIAGACDRYTLEKRYRRNDGAVVWGRLAVAGVRDAAGKLVHTVSMIEDVTEERHLQEARHKSDEKFATAFRMSPIPSVISRLEDGVLVDVNEAYCVASGFTRDAVIGKGAREVLWPSPDMRDAFLEHLSAHGRVRDLQVRMRTKAGPALDVLLSVERIELDGVPHILGSAVDITDRERAAAALRQSEEKFAKAFRVSPNALGITELETGILVDANEAFFATFGYARDEAIGRPSRDLIWPDPGQRDVYAAKLKTQGRLQSEEVTLRTKSGATVLALISAELIELGGRTYVLTNVLNITERKRALEALRESEQRFRRLVQDMSIGVALLDAQGRVIHANPAARDILAISDAELSDPTFWQRGMVGLQEDGTPFPEDERPVLNAVRTGTPLRNVLMGAPARGRAEPRWALVNVDPQRDPDGTVRNVIVWFSDVTEQRKADQQLRLLAQAVKSTSEMITITDREGRFTFVNRSFAETYGYTEEELLGRHVALIDSPRNPRGLQDELRAVTAARGVWIGELWNRRKDGTEFLIALTTAQVKDPQGRVIALMGVSSDITERKQLQESLRRSETMSALGAVVAGVAHEVRNPLFAISATVDAFEARFGGEPARERYSTTLRQEVNRLTKLMQDLLEFGKPQRLDVSLAEVTPVLRRAIAASTPLAESQDVTIHDQLPGDLPPIPMDQSRIQQVFQNLLDNAIQHSPRGGSVTIAGTRHGNGAPDMLEITFADQGSGFREEDLPRLFEPFYTRRRGGTGLGLSIVQRILEQHDGEVAARNGASGGAVITVRLPLERSAVRV